MAPKTLPYRNQHVELTHLATVIPIDPSEVSAREASHALACLRGVLIVHLKLQDGMLYPWMMRQPSVHLRDKAQQYRQMMSAFLIAFLEFYRRWSCADAIAADPVAFISAWRIVRALLKHRLSAEADDLYPAIEAQATEQDLALAS